MLRTGGYLDEGIVVVRVRSGEIQVPGDTSRPVRFHCIPTFLSASWALSSTMATSNVAEVLPTGNVIREDVWVRVLL